MYCHRHSGADGDDCYDGDDDDEDDDEDNDEDDMVMISSLHRLDNCCLKPLHIHKADSNAATVRALR